MGSEQSAPIPTHIGALVLVNAFFIDGGAGIMTGTIVCGGSEAHPCVEVNTRSGVVTGAIPAIAIVAAAARRDGSAASSTFSSARFPRGETPVSLAVGALSTAAKNCLIDSLSLSDLRNIVEVCLHGNYGAEISSSCAVDGIVAAAVERLASDDDYAVEMLGEYDQCGYGGKLYTISMVTTKKARRESRGAAAQRQRGLSGAAVSGAAADNAVAATAAIVCSTVAELSTEHRYSDVSRQAQLELLRELLSTALQLIAQGDPFVRRPKAAAAEQSTPPPIAAAAAAAAANVATPVRTASRRGSNVVYNAVQGEDVEAGARLLLLVSTPVANGTPGGHRQSLEPSKKRDHSALLNKRQLALARLRVDATEFLRSAISAIPPGEFAERLFRLLVERHPSDRAIG